MTPEAIALIEFASIPAGTRAVDAIVKKAPVKLERAGTLQPGMFAVLFSGDVASVSESYREALAVGGGAVRDKMMLPHVEPTVYRAVHGHVGQFRGDTLGVLETCSMAGTIEAADAAVKGAAVSVVRIRLGDELGGKGLAHFIGEQHDVEAALEIGVARIAGANRTVDCSIIPRVDAEVLGLLSRGARFWEAG